MGHYKRASGAQAFLHVVREPVEVLKPACTKGGTVYLHNIDQQVFFYSGLIFVYNPPEEQEDLHDVLGRLRKGLSEVLVPYSFLAGRLHVNEDEARLELDCNAEGVLFAGARCDSTTIEELNLRVPSPDFRKLLVYPTGAKRIEDIPLLTVQATRFNCGGMVIGMSVHHSAADGISANEFFTNFGRAAMGQPLMLLGGTPTPDRTCLKARDPPQTSFDHKELVQLPDVPAKLLFSLAASYYDPEAILQHDHKIFAFTSEMLSQLRNQAMEDGSLSRCSTFEALAGYMWRARTLAVGEHDDQVAKLFLAADMRHKLKEKPLPRNFCGNAVIAAPCFETSAEVRNQPLSFAVKKVQEALGMVDEEFIHSHLDWCQKMKHGIIDLPGSFAISPWSRLGFDQVEFGWGKPKYAAPVVSERVGYALVLPNCKQDGGLDVFIAMETDKMAKMEKLLDQDVTKAKRELD